MFYRKRLTVHRATNKSANSESKVYLKDILIPLFTASLAVGFNQLFFTSNKKAEAMVDFQKERIKQQIPALNRIFAFTYKFSISEMGFTSDTFYLKKRGESGYIDTIHMGSVNPKTIHKAYTYAFVTDSTFRKGFEEDLNIIRQSRDFLSPHIYVYVDKILLFLQLNKLPNLDDIGNMINSVWFEKNVQAEWENLIMALRDEALKEVEGYVRD